MISSMPQLPAELQRETSLRDKVKKATIDVVKSASEKVLDQFKDLFGADGNN